MNLFPTFQGGEEEEAEESIWRSSHVTRIEWKRQPIDRIEEMTPELLLLLLLLLNSPFFFPSLLNKNNKSFGLWKANWSTESGVLLGFFSILYPALQLSSPCGPLSSLWGLCFGSETVPPVDAPSFTLHIY